MKASLNHGQKVKLTFLKSVCSRSRWSRDYIVKIYFKVKKNPIEPEKARLAQIIKQIKEEIGRERMLRRGPKKYNPKYEFKGRTYTAPS